MRHTGSPYDLGLEKNAANHVALSPLSYIERAAHVYPDRVAIVYGERRQTWRDTYTRSRRLASALAARGVGKNDTVAVMLPNVPAMFEAHFGVPMAGAVLNTLNTRLDPEAIAFMLEHGEAKVLLTDREFASVVAKALDLLQGPRPYVVEVEDDTAPEGAYLGDTGYEAFLPMFHCNGWCFPWTMALIAGTSVCLRRVDPALIFPLVRQHHITHLCGAPIVYSMLIHAPATLREGISHTVHGLIAGAAPPAAVIEGCEAAGINLTHVYGLTEVYGPAAVCAKQESWASLSAEERARLNGRQGVPYPLQQAVTVLDPETMEPMLAAVVARPDDKWGEVPCAFVELKAGASATEQEVVEFCRTHLARFKVPKQVVFGALPKTSTGKIQKFVLRGQVKSVSAID